MVGAPVRGVAVDVIATDVVDQAEGAIDDDGVDGETVLGDEGGAGVTEGCAVGNIGVTWVVDVAIGVAETGERVVGGASVAGRADVVTGACRRCNEEEGDSEWDTDNELLKV